LNQCPFLAPEKTLAAEQAILAGIDVNAAKNYRNVLANDAALREHLLSVMVRDANSTSAQADEDHHERTFDADLALYSGGFLSQQSHTHARMIREANPEALADINLPWDDTRLPILLFRYRARNFPHTLSPAEIHRWRQHCQNRLMHGEDGFLGSDEYMLKIEQLAEAHQNDPQKMAILKALANYLLEL
jgi:exodeoxyribonuclease-1